MNRMEHEVFETKQALQLRSNELVTEGFRNIYQELKESYWDIILKKGQHRVLLTWKR